MSVHLMRWRPRYSWQTGTDVRVELDLNSIHAGNGVHGQECRTVDCHVGDANVYKVDARTHQMQVFSNTKLLRTRRPVGHAADPLRGVLPRSALVGGLPGVG